jgi:hypothetical protein
MRGNAMRDATLNKHAETQILSYARNDHHALGLHVLPWV